tara:strand:- start:6833 stop:7201 length:369 start_codon:yes stop_codon:yes gene_type:complete
MKKPLTALIIEDNPDNMELISVILQANNITVIPIFNGLDGVHAASNLLFDFILLDIQLPDITGFEVIKRIRAARVVQPVIAVTSYAMSGDRQVLMNSGCDGYIEKPIDPSIIINQILAIIEL